MSSRAQSQVVPSPGDRVLLSVRELVRLTGLGDETIYRHLRAGRIPGVRRIGRSVFVARAAFEKWLADGRSN